MDDRVTFPEELTEMAVEILRRAGMETSSARVVATSLVESDLAGHTSHGVRRLPQYLRWVRDGVIDARAAGRVASRSGATAIVDGEGAFGQLAARCAVDEVASLCESFAVGVASIRNCNHVGRLGEYVADLARRGLVAMAVSNADPTVAPFGGRERRLGTNPMAWALPREADAAPLVMDWATSGVAEGKLAVARARGTEVAPDLLLDASGRPSTDPEDFYQGGALLPFGGHKGYGLSVVIEIVGGLLSQAGISSLPGYAGHFGTVLLAIRIDAFVPVEVFRSQAERFCAELGGTAPSQGADEVLLPGESEERTRARRLADGIPLPHNVWRELRELHHTAHEYRSDTGAAGEHGT